VSGAGCLMVLVATLWLGYHVGWLAGDTSARRRYRHLCSGGCSAPMRAAAPKRETGISPEEAGLVCDGCGQGICPPQCPYYWEGRCEGCGRPDDECPMPGPDCLYAQAVLDAHEFDPEP
jgi:hypothetical protein